MARERRQEEEQEQEDEDEEGRSVGRWRPVGSIEATGRSSTWTCLMVSPGRERGAS